VKGQIHYTPEKKEEGGSGRRRNIQVLDKGKKAKLQAELTIASGRKTRKEGIAKTKRGGGGSRKLVNRFPGKAKKAEEEAS